MPDFIDPDSEQTFSLGTVPIADWVSAINSNDDLMNLGNSSDGVPLCIASCSGQSIATSTVTKVQLTVVHDPYGMIDTSNNKFDLISVGPGGVYLVGYSIGFNFATPGTTSRVFAHMTVPDDFFDPSAPSSSGDWASGEQLGYDTVLHHVEVVYHNVEFWVWTNASSQAIRSAYMWALYLGTG